MIIYLLWTTALKHWVCCLWLPSYCQTELSESLQATYTLCGGQNRLSEPLPVSYTLCGTQNVPLRTSTSFVYALWLFKRTLRSYASIMLALPLTRLTLQSLQALYPPWCSQNGLSELASRKLPHALRLSKRTLRTSTSVMHAFVVVKTDSSNMYKLHVRCELVKTDSPNFYKPPTRFAVIKMDFRTSTRFIRALRYQNGLSQLLQASCLPWGI